jgi:glycerol uptake facilitator-like aquaporin
MACIYGLGGITGGASNPAVAAFTSSVGMTFWNNIGAFLLGQLLAGVMALFVFIYLTGVSLKNRNTNNRYSIYKTFFNSII